MTERKSPFICPICRTELERVGQSLLCRGEKKHTYDVASSGYVNLLPPGKKSNSRTGDDREMLKARSAFLALGHYDKISTGLAQAAEGALSEIKELTFVDAGCGEGHHALNMLKYFESKGISCKAVGLDASKHGAAMGARTAGKERLPASFAAANIFDMPLADKSADIVFSMFAPIPETEAVRVLKDDGVLAVCSSGTMHLLEMRNVLYDETRISPPLDPAPQGFVKVLNTSLEYGFELLGRDNIEALLKMTPFYYRCPAEGRERLLAMDSITLTASVEYNIYKKANNS